MSTKDLNVIKQRQLKFIQDIISGNIRKMHDWRDENILSSEDMETLCEFNLALGDHLKEFKFR